MAQLAQLICSLSFDPRGGGTDPRKVRVGLDRAGKFELYLYKCTKNGGLFYIFFMKKGGLFYIFFEQNSTNRGES